MMGFGIIVPILVIGLIAYILGWRPQGESHLSDQAHRGQPPEEILKQRYARGDISKAEFDQMLEDLLRN